MTLEDDENDNATLPLPKKVDVDQTTTIPRVSTPPASPSTTTVVSPVPELFVPQVKTTLTTGLTEFPLSRGWVLKFFSRYQFLWIILVRKHMLVRRYQI